jgi:hypothetical protein
MAGSSRLSDERSISDCVQILLHIMQAADIGMVDLLSVCGSLRELCAAPIIRRQLAFKDAECDKCIASDRLELYELGSTMFTRLPIIINGKLIAWRITLLLQHNHDLMVCMDGLTALMHLMEDEDEDVNKVVISNSAFVQRLISLLQNGTDPTLKLLVASTITACVGGRADLLQVFSEAGGPLILAETADLVLSGAEMGYISISPSGFFQKLMDLISTSISAKSSSLEPGSTDRTALRVAVTDKALLSRYEQLLKPEVDQDPEKLQGQALSADQSEPVAHVGVSAEDASGNIAPLRPFGWLFRGTAVPSAVKRSPRSVQGSDFVPRFGKMRRSKLAFFLVQEELMPVHWSLAGPMNNFAASSSCSCQNSLLSPKGRKSASSDRLSSADHRLLVDYLATKRCLTRTDHFPVPCCNLNSGMQPLLCPPGQEAARPPGGAQLGPLDITTCDGNTLKLSYLFRQPARLSRPMFWEYKALEDSVTRSGFGTGPVSPDESATKMPTTLQSILRVTSVVIDGVSRALWTRVAL